MTKLRQKKFLKDWIFGNEIIEFTAKLQAMCFCCFFYSDCSASLPFYVRSESSIYNSSGIIECSRNGTLHYVNGTAALLPRNSRCLYTAKWSEIEDVECWNGKYLNN